MATISRFEDLEIWQMARRQAIELHDISARTALSKDFDLRNQMSRSSGSVMDCIAEGFERSGNQEFRHFLIIAKGSNGEYRSQLYRCLDRGHITKEEFDRAYDFNCMIGKKIMAFVDYLQKSILKGETRRQKTTVA